jgi:hypothetical protein
MKKFLVTYLAPASVIDEWKKTEPKQRKEAEEDAGRMEKMDERSHENLR